MLKMGDEAPDFVGADCRGEPVRLSAYRGRRVVLFFYPKTFTIMCTAEARAFRDNHELVKALGAELIGVSTDSTAVQCEFAAQEDIQFPLLGDESREISTKYEVVWPGLNRDRRMTFIVGPEGKIEEIIRHEMRVWRHLDDVLAHLKKQQLAVA